MSEYIVAMSCTVDIDSGEELDKYYKVYLREPSGTVWFEHEFETEEQARKYVDISESTEDLTVAERVKMTEEQ